MARGVGYAGEGDVLTAALLGALLTICPDSSFVEMFCPGWSDDTLFLSHMGELNPSLTAGRPRVIKKPMPYAGDGDTVGLTGRYRAGEAVLVNLTPMGMGFRLILSPVELLDREDGLSDFVSGWLRSSLPLPEFLEAFSLMGGTHHSALCYGAKLDLLRLFGRLAGLETRVIGEIRGYGYGG